MAFQRMGSGNAGAVQCFADWRDLAVDAAVGQGTRSRVYPDDPDIDDDNPGVGNISNRVLRGIVAVGLRCFFSVQSPAVTERDRNKHAS